MLVLTRDIDGAIVIGDNIKIIITKIDRNQVSIDIEAPKDVNIARKELLGND